VLEIPTPYVHQKNNLDDKKNPVKGGNGNDDGEKQMVSPYYYIQWQAI